MTLYHGSNEDIQTIDLERGLRFKDFGKGFYLTPDKSTATRMAKKSKAFRWRANSDKLRFVRDSSLLRPESENIPRESQRGYEPAITPTNSNLPDQLRPKRIGEIRY